MTTVPPISRSALILEGVAALLVVPGWLVYRATGDYADGEQPITFEELAPAGPGVALTIYGEDPIDTSSTRYHLQARIRTTDDPLDLALVDHVGDVLSWRRHPPMPEPIDVVQIRPESRARLGRISGAYQHTRNFSLWT